MNNLELVAIFERIADLMEIKGELVFKVQAYRRAAESLFLMVSDANQVLRDGKLEKIPGVGKAIAGKIEELLTTGKLGFLEELEKEVPPGLLEILKVPDVGPKKAALFWKQAGITDLNGLEVAASDGKLRTLPGMGEKSEGRVLDGIEALKRMSKRKLLGEAWPVAREWLEWLRQIPGVIKAEPAGSLRRWKSTIGDIDLVAAVINPEQVMELFTHHQQVARILSQGEKKSSVELKNGFNIQLWMQPPERFGTLWQYATGSKEHNVHLREIAQLNGYSLSEKGLLDAAGREHPFLDERSLYATLGLLWIPPELREERGEIQAALTGSLPRLIETDDLQGELHSHTDWTDGYATLEEMVEAARKKGFRFYGITDHSSGLGVAGGLNAERLMQQRHAVHSLQEKLGDSIHLLHGVEVEIRADGSLDYPDEVLAELDIVIASLHSGLRQPREIVTERLLKAMANPNVDIIGHPSGRLLPTREAADLDWEKVLDGALKSGVALEINSNPNRLDLDEVYARKANEMGILLSVDTDAHRPASLDLAVYGVSVARRAWVEADRVINTWPLEKLLGWLKSRK